MSAVQVYIYVCVYIGVPMPLYATAYFYFRFELGLCTRVLFNGLKTIALAARRRRTDNIYAIIPALLTLMPPLTTATLIPVGNNNKAGCRILD